MTLAHPPGSAGIADAAEPGRQPDSGAAPSPVEGPPPHIPFDARGAALIVLASVAAVYALSWAQGFLIPLLLGIVLAYTLNPLVSWLEAAKLPRVVATMIVMVGVLGALALGGYALRGQIQAIVAQLPAAATKFAGAMARLQAGSGDTMQKMQKAAAEVEKATTAVGTVPRPAAARVIVEPQKFELSGFLWESSMGALGALGQASMVLFLVFFLLIGGDRFKRKLVKLTGPTLTKRKVTVKILDDITESIQKYLLMLLTTNLAIALLNWVAFRWIGLENAGAWGAAAGLLHVIPYLGPAVAAGATAMAAFMQFDSFAMAFLVGGVSLGIATLIGTFVTTWMTGRIASMNAAAVFVGFLFWGWLWGIWGLLLSVPIVVIVKVVSEHVEALRPIDELLGE